MSDPGNALTRSQVRQLRLSVQRRREGHDEIEERWFRTIADVIDSGASVRAVATYLGVSRQAVYDWLKRAEAR